jgi:curved DNA-binding protein CbpA
MHIPWLLFVYILFGILSITRSNEPNYYKVLDVSPKASVDEIKKSYRSLAKKYHPDKNRDGPSAEQKFISITKAYEVLSDPQQRAVFDDSLRHSGGRGNPFGNQDGNTMRNWRSNRPRSTNMEDIYRGFGNSFDDFGDGSTTYMFKGPDGRVYYTRSSGFRFQYSSPPRQDNADVIQYILYGLLWPFLQVILLLLCCSSMFQRCCGSTTKNRRANTADHYAQNPSHHNRYQNSQNKPNTTSLNSSEPSYQSSPSTSSTIVPVVSEPAVLQRGTIIIVAISPLGLTIVNNCKAQFKHDPVSFFTMNEFTTVSTASYDSIETLSNEIKKSPIQTLLQSLPISELQSCDIIAFSKQGKKYAVCIRDNNEVFPDWLEQLLEGQITWMMV